jgi:uncharacterized protein (DUF934 family)
MKLFFTSPSTISTHSTPSTDLQSASQAAISVLRLTNDIDVLRLGNQLQGIERIDLHFPKFSDGRAFSQAVLLRQRLHFAGELHATGDVLIDQLLQMQRTGFSHAQLRSDQDLAHGEHLLTHFAGFYQGDVQAEPLFATR